MPTPPGFVADLDFGRQSDLDEVIALGRERIGMDFVDRAVLMARHARQPECLAVVRSGAAIQAFSLVYALTERATQAVVRGSVINGSMLAVDALAGDGSARSIYVGAVASSTASGVRALVLLQRHVVWMLDRHTRVEFAFARAATDAGTSLLARLGFEPFDPPSDVQFRRVADEPSSPHRTPATNASWLAWLAPTRRRR
jgi:hypothetical protein